MRLNLSASALHQLDDGAAGAIIDRALATAIADLDDRGEDDQARKVVITLTGVRDEKGLIDWHLEAGAKIPPFRTAKTKSRLHHRADGELSSLFSAHAPEDPDQVTIDEAMPEK